MVVYPPLEVLLDPEGNVELLSGERWGLGKTDGHLKLQWDLVVRSLDHPEGTLWDLEGSYGKLVVHCLLSLRGNLDRPDRNTEEVAVEGTVCHD